MRKTTDTLTRPVSGADEAKVSRRALLKVGATAAGGLALTVALPSWSMAAGSDSGAVLNAFVRIEPDGRVRLTMPSVEMGQGVYTSLSMLLAEELEVKLDQIEVEHAPPNDALYANPFLHLQATGLSASIRGFWLPLRQAGAAARLMLIAAAAGVGKSARRPAPSRMEWFCIRRALGRCPIGTCCDPRPNQSLPLSIASS